MWSIGCQSGASKVHTSKQIMPKENAANKPLKSIQYLTNIQSGWFGNDWLAGWLLSCEVLSLLS